MLIRIFLAKLVMVTAVVILLGGAAGARAGTAAALDSDVTGRAALATAPSFVLAVNTSGQEAGKGAQDFVQSMASRAINFLGNSALSIESKKESFRGLLRDSFDMKTIGRFAMGRYWRTATPQQRDEYQRLFEKMVINVYSQRFSDYQGQKFEARSVRMDADGDALVTSFIIPETGAEIQVDWRVRHKNGSYKVVDVMVEGVSMAVTQRSDFSAVIQRGGGDVQVLIDHLRAM